MAEAIQYMFNHKELVELMIKKQGLHEGIWSLSVRFGIHATNFGPSPEADQYPTAIVPLMEIGIHRAEKETNIAVDAAKVNPLPRDASSGKRHSSRH